jgi:hypothetical protein
MKAFILVFSLIFALGTLQAAPVIQNGEDAQLYFTTLPYKAEDVTRFNQVSGALPTYIRDNSRNFVYLPPRGARELSGQAGQILLIGFFLTPGADNAPVILMKLPDSPGRPTFTATRGYIFRGNDRNPLSMPVWDLALKSAAIQLDNRYLDWLKVPELARFAPAFTPVVFNRETRGRRELQKIQDSLHWRKGGTQIETIKALRDGGSLNFMFSTLSEMADGLSFFFYVFDDRLTGSKAAFSLEVPVRGAWGPVLLWLSDEKKPRQIGEFVRNQFYLEGRVDLAALPPAKPEAVSGGIDVASCFFGGGSLEEFQFTTINLADIPIRP